MIPPVEDVAEVVNAWAKKEDSEEHKLVFYLATPAHVTVLKRVPVRLAYFGAHRSGLLFVRKVGREPDRVHRDIAHRLNWQRHQMGVERVFWDASCTRLGPRTCPVCDPSLDDFPPFRMRTFPSLVVEAGYDTATEPLRSLKDWWFHNTPTGSGVAMVLLVRICVASRELELELWHRNAAVPSSIVTVFSAGGGASGWIATGPMTIPFESVVLRPKDTRNCDFVLDQPHLAALAAYVFFQGPTP